jgi:DNA polymerase
MIRNANQPYRGCLMTKIVIVGEAWGKEEAQARLPFIGTSGKILDGMLRQAGIRREDCFLTNVFNFQPEGKYPDNDLKNVCGTKAEGISGFPALSSGKYVRVEFASELTRLYKEIANESPNVIIAFGATAAWALLGTSGIRKIRGAPSLLSGLALETIGKPIKVFPTYHPSAVIREWTLRPIVVADLHKAAHEAEFPELRRPEREIWIEPDLNDLAIFERDFIIPSDSLSIDIETAGDQITCVGFAPTIDRAIVVPLVDAVKPDGNYWPSLAAELKAWDYIRRWCAMTLPGSPNYKRGVGQNFLYDIHRLWRTYGIPVHGEDDTMLAHHALQPEMEKGLGFLATIYTRELAWKFMRAKHETLKKED